MAVVAAPGKLAALAGRAGEVMNTRRIVSVPIGAAQHFGKKTGHLTHAAILENDELVAVLCKRVKLEHLLEDWALFDKYPVDCPECIRKMAKLSKPKRASRKARRYWCEVHGYAQNFSDRCDVDNCTAPGHQTGGRKVNPKRVPRGYFESRLALSSITVGPTKRRRRRTNPLGKSAFRRPAGGAERSARALHDIYTSMARGVSRINRRPKLERAKRYVLTADRAHAARLYFDGSRNFTDKRKDAKTYASADEVITIGKRLFRTFGAVLKGYELNVRYA